MRNTFHFSKLLKVVIYPASSQERSKQKVMEQEYEIESLIGRNTDVEESVRDSLEL